MPYALVRVWSMIAGSRGGCEEGGTGFQMALKPECQGRDGHPPEADYGATSRQSQTRAWGTWTHRAWFGQVESVMKTRRPIVMSQI